MEKDGFLPIGKVVGTHGVKGTLKIFSDSESLSLFDPGSSIFIQNIDGSVKSWLIRWLRPHKRFFLLSLEGISDIDRAQNFKGARILIDRTSLPQLEEGVYYWSDLIGLRVFLIDGTCLGNIESIIETGSNDVYVVRKGNRETLIPALEKVVKVIDLESKTMQVDLPEGL
ncbi:MAG: 16S rRNA processing protein RimM [Desulfobacteraceae bacterium 4572_123]|nr:MAG: 16S rRNA processing protein RimM [Desulfobacteraceae bacterium 4572_123]